MNALLWRIWKMTMKWKKMKEMENTCRIVWPGTMEIAADCRLDSICVTLPFFFYFDGRASRGVARRREASRGVVSVVLSAASFPLRCAAGNGPRKSIQQRRLMALRLYFHFQSIPIDPGRQFRSSLLLQFIPIKVNSIRHNYLER